MNKFTTNEFSEDTAAAAAYSVSGLFVLHAVLLGLAWLLMAPFGVLISRYGKPGPGVKPAGPARWYVWHRAVQTSAVALTVVGVAISLAETGSEFQSHFFHAHGSLGLAVALLAGAAPTTPRRVTHSNLQPEAEPRQRRTRVERHNHGDTTRTTTSSAQLTVASEQQSCSS